MPDEELTLMKSVLDRRLEVRDKCKADSDSGVGVVRLIRLVRQFA